MFTGKKSRTAQDYHVGIYESWKDENGEKFKSSSDFKMISPERLILVDLDNKLMQSMKNLGTYDAHEDEVKDILDRWIGRRFEKF